MTISIWRYSHLTLAISSFLFILVASLTGIILAFEPISNQLKPFEIPQAKEQSIAKTIMVLKSKYNEIIEIKIDDNDFVIASVITKQGDNETFYVNPINGEKVADIIEKAPIFKFATNLHRSLFLKSTGRFFVALGSFLLFLITITGVILIIKRQGSIRKFFHKIVNENFYQYYHIILGRLFLIPILLITLSGVYLSLEKFDILPKYNANHIIDFDVFKSTPKQDIDAIETFKNVTLKDVKRIEFPFSSAVEDYYTIELRHKEVLVNQITGSIISERYYPFHKMVSYYSLFIHTGRGSILWSVLLLIASCVILFFVYSGFSMTLSRKKRGGLPKNKIRKDAAEYIVLVGSETGNTLSLALLFFNALRVHKKVFISELNDYTRYKKAKHVIIFTATYGVGEAPSNARKFIDTIEKKVVSNSCFFSVVGFGSLAYPDFCQFAIVIDEILQKQTDFTQFLPLEKVNNQSFSVFEKWVSTWTQKEQVSLKMEQFIKNQIKITPFKVIDISSVNSDQTFTIRLKPVQRVKFQSGDLLSIYPKEDGVERQYSIGKIDGDILLSVKKHNLGICSTYLSRCTVNELVNAQIKQNREFHFPKDAEKVILIANGTGIAPFLGMLQECDHTKKEIQLFWGGRTKESFDIYRENIQSLKNRKLFKFDIAYSQEKEKKYVQELLLDKIEYIANALTEGTVFMICGSIAMQQDVLEILKSICEQKLKRSLRDFELNGQLKIDCY